MFFKILNKKYLSTEQLRTDTLMQAYFIIEKYPLKASDKILDDYLCQQYKTSLKDLCIKLLLSLTYHADEDNNLILVFKEPKHDELARIITYGTGNIVGSKILKIALTIGD